MSNLRYFPKSQGEVPVTAFGSAEEAWFWFVRCQQVRREGAHLGDGGGQFARPCDPDDVYCAAISLARRGLISRAHLVTLGTFGLHGRPPDARCRDEATASRLWDEALDRLGTVLRSKGIVA
jgi:hypothetical protein